MLRRSRCSDCVHYRYGNVFRKAHCDAYPEGVPFEIYMSRARLNEPCSATSDLTFKEDPRFAIKYGDCEDKDFDFNFDDLLSSFEETS